MYLYFIDGVLWFTCTSPSSLVEKKKQKTNQENHKTKQTWLGPFSFNLGGKQAERGTSSTTFAALKSLLVVCCPTSEIKGSGKRQESGVRLPLPGLSCPEGKSKLKKKKKGKRKEKKRIFNSQPPLDTTANSNKRYWVHVKYVDTHEQSLFWL